MEDVDKSSDRPRLDALVYGAPNPYVNMDDFDEEDEDEDVVVLHMPVSRLHSQNESSSAHFNAQSGLLNIPSSGTSTSNANNSSYAVNAAVAAAASAPTSKGAPAFSVLGSGGGSSGFLETNLTDSAGGFQTSRGTIMTPSIGPTPSTFSQDLLLSMSNVNVQNPTGDHLIAVSLSQSRLSGVVPASAVATAATTATSLASVSPALRSSPGATASRTPNPTATTPPPTALTLQQQTQQQLQQGNVYNSIAFPPLNAKALEFRMFLNQKAVPSSIENEEWAGVFVGQLPSSYSEDDIEALLKAIGNESGHIVQVRDVKCHNRDRTCAFVMINAGALTAVLQYTKRVLCDVNCVWVVEPSLAAQLPVYVQQMPRDMLRGVPKAALVLERLTPQVKKSRSNTSAAAAGGNTPPSVRSVYGAPTGPTPYGAQAEVQRTGSQPLFIPSGFVEVAGGYSASYPAGAMLAAPTMSFLSASPYGAGAPAQLFTSASGLSSGITPIYAMPPLASLEATNQAILSAAAAAAVSSSARPSALRHSGVVSGVSLNGMATVPLGVTTSASTTPPTSATPSRLPTAVSLQPVLQTARCSCGQSLHLSQSAQETACISCNSEVEANSIAYWCPLGHVVVCSQCALRSNQNNAPGAARATPESSMHLPVSHQGSTPSVGAGGENSFS